MTFVQLVILEDEWIVFHFGTLQILLSIIVTSAMSSVANAMGFTAIFLPHARNTTSPLYMDEYTIPWYASINSLASLFGSLSAGFLMDRFGRRISFMAPFIPIILLWCFTASARSVGVLFFCRIGLGYFLAFIPVTCQIYLAESSDPHLRSLSVNMGYVSLSTGMLVPFALAAFFGWQTIAMACIVLPTIILFSIAIIPETPVWLVRNGHNAKALQSLTWLRGNQVNANNELNQLTTRLEADKLREEEQKQSFWAICAQKAVYRPTIIVFCFIILLHISGTYVIVLYAMDIVHALELPMLNTTSATILMFSVRVTVTVLFCWLFMHVPRRKIYMFAGTGSTLATTTLAIYLFGDFSKDIDETIDVCVKGALMAIYIATNTGFQITPGFMIGELLPARVRGRVGGYLYTVFNIATFSVTNLFPSVRESIGIEGVLIVWATASLASTILIYFTVPETHGKTLHEIEDYFRDCGWIYRQRTPARQQTGKTDAIKPEFILMSECK